MNNKLINKYYHPMLYFFLLPLISLLFGTLLAFPYSQLRLLRLVFFYLYILTNQLLENILLKIPKSNFKLSKGLFIILEMIILFFILFFSWNYSITAGITLFLYTLIIQLRFLFSYYDLEKIAAIIAGFLKAVLLNGFAFYIHTHFISLDHFFDYAVIVIPYSVYELSRMNSFELDRSLKILSALAYPAAILLLWPKHSYFSLFILLVLPLLWPKKDSLTSKNTAIILMISSFVYWMFLFITAFL